MTKKYMFPLTGVALWAALAFAPQPVLASQPPAAAPQATAPALPPGHNVFVVGQRDKTVFYRGGAPTQATLDWLAQQARAQGVPFTLVDLRVPQRDYDTNGEGGRLTPAQEKARLAQLGGRYLPVSALDKNMVKMLVPNLTQPGLVYIHCQYGVNRTGFAIGRYATATGIKVDTTGLGARDFNQGVAFEKKLQAKGKQ